MSLLAGFDFLTEISNPTLLKMIKATVQIGGVSLNPPFELTLSITGGSAHIVVNDVQLDLNDDDTVSLHLAFVDTSTVLGQPPFSKVVCPMSGVITARAPVKIVPGPGSTCLVEVSMANVIVSISYTVQADQVITDDLIGSGITPALFKEFALDAITNFVKTTPNITMPMGFNVVPGVDGSLTPLQFSSLQVRCIGHADRSKQALGLFGNLLVATQNNGNHTQKTVTDITLGDDMAVSISPGAFHTLVFCPAVATALKVSMNNLPTSCGESSGVDVHGITIKAVTDSFANGQINVNGSVATSGFCYDASGTFHGAITFSISGSQLQPNIQIDETNVDIDIPWYCYLAAGLVLGPIGTVILDIVDDVSSEVAKVLASYALINALGAGISGVGLSGFSGGVLTGFGITTEGITLRGLMPIFLPISTFWKHNWLDGSVTTASRTALSSGVYTTKFLCMPVAKDYPYTEYAQNQVATYNLESRLIATPISAVYSLRLIPPGANPVQLTGTSGTVVLADIGTTYQTPLATGGTKVTQNVHVDYEVSGTQVKLRNRPEEGNFSVYLMCQFTDCGGGALSPQNQTVTFMGNNVEFGGTYYEDYQECMDYMREMIDRITDKYKQFWKYVPIWVKVNYPAPEEIISQIRILTEAGVQETEDMLLQSRLAHGASFVRALHADSETKLGRAAKPEIPSAQAAARESLVKAQISELTTQLEALNLAKKLGIKPVFRKS